MKNIMLCVLILLGFHLTMGDNTLDIPAADIPSHVDQFMNANPQSVSGAVPPASPSDATKCECAVFNTETPAEMDNPILTQAPMSISCDAAGEQNCNKLCSALAEAAKGRGPQLLCSTLGHYDKLKASVHSRVCGAKTWTYTGLTSPNEICCHDHQLIDCKDQVENPPENET